MKREGFALVLVLLVVAAVELITLSTIALATHESVAVSAQEQSVSASRAAEAAIRRLIRRWPHPAVESLHVSQTASLVDSTNVVVTVRRNTWGQYLVTAAAPAGGSWIREVALLETIDVGRAVEEANLALVTRGPVSAANARFSAAPHACVLPAAPTGGDTLLTANARYAFGGHEWRELSTLADSGFVFSAGDVVLASGVHDGVFVVSGNMTIASGAVVSGVAVVGGGLTIEDGVHITGSIIVRGRGSSTVGAADLVFSPCAVAHALLQTPASRRLIRSQRRFIPAF
ncbi:MAG TPA: hypothetical protein VFZ04_00985 [Longimicrobiales bacterium]